jgi:hypothetical protein
MLLATLIFFGWSLPEIRLLSYMPENGQGKLDFDEVDSGRIVEFPSDQMKKCGFASNISGKSAVQVRCLWFDPSERVWKMILSDQSAKPGTKKICPFSKLRPDLLAVNKDYKIKFVFSDAASSLEIQVRYHIV